MSEFNKYSDGCICFEEFELKVLSKYLSETEGLFTFARNHNFGVNETLSMMNGVCKIVKAYEMWREEKVKAMRGADEIEHGNCSNG